MIFITYEPYNVDTIVHDLSECFICYEIQNSNELPIRLNGQSNYIKSCKCDGWVHKSCFNCWYKTNNNCPICRKNIFVVSDISNIIKKNNINKLFHNSILFLKILFKITLFIIFYMYLIYLFISDIFYIVFYYGIKNTHNVNEIY
jgi:hypothetical protein